MNSESQSYKSVYLSPGPHDASRRKLRNTILKDLSKNWVRWCIPVIPALGDLRQEDFLECEASLEYLVNAS